jgi:hypothetical protein
LRNALTDYLQFAIDSGNPYGAIVERLKQSVLRARATRIVDLCSGGGGPWRRLHREFASTNFPIEVCLTDKYPNLAAFRLAQTESGGKLSFFPEPVNAESVTHELKGYGDYLWESGEEKHPRSPIPVTYLIGYPSANFAEEGAMEK